jgi:hypothetical protein
MNDIRNLGQEVQAEILKTARKGQDAVVSAIRTWTDTVRSITPPLKDLNLPFADRLPFASRLPKPEELAGNAYEFAQKLLASQRKFAEDVLRAAAPLLPGTGDADKKSEAADRSEADKKDSPAERKNRSADK